ncbi:hypothetical protein WJX75_008583 [Coccomyxa subellipsoidea]|uniref:Uncharacterized protein n=1 Tax=Coccomyxa subellipsoidea TaxID=248742 RepID=A0ABR2YQG3_9CHLO
MKPISAIDVMLQEVAGNGPASKKGGRHSIMTTVVDAAAAQMLLPIFLESLQKVSRRLVPRLLVLASDAEGLQICRAKHAHCLPWFQRLNPE